MSRTPPLNWNKTLRKTHHTAAKYRPFGPLFFLFFCNNHIYSLARIFVSAYDFPTAEHVCSVIVEITACVN